jgi:hypothetical protein
VRYAKQYPEKNQTERGVCSTRLPNLSASNLRALNIDVSSLSSLNQGPPKKGLESLLAQKPALLSHRHVMAIQLEGDRLILRA